MADTTPAPVPAYAAPVVADLKSQLKLGLDAVKSLVDGIMSGEEKDAPTVSEDVKNTVIGALDAHLTGFTKELLDMGLSAGGSSALEGYVAEASTVEKAQLALFQQTIDAHLAALGA